MNDSIVLFDEHPLTIPKETAKRIGLNEAIVIQQVHYWVFINQKKNHNLQDGYYWTYNTYAEWKSEFPFWSLMTIRRIISRLEKSGYLISANFNRKKYDRTKWYRVDYSRLSVNSPCVQNEQSTGVQNEQLQEVNMNTPIPETNTETTPETTFREKKHSYGFFDNVLLTDVEYEKLKERFGVGDTTERISELSHAIASKGYKYKSHYATILNWARKDGNNGTHRGNSEKTDWGIGKPLDTRERDFGIGKPLR